MIRVLIVEDQLLIAAEIKELLSAYTSEIEVVGIACDGKEAIEKISALSADVALMDIKMPNMNGVIATREIKSLYPNVKILILTTFDDSEYILDAINFGASGYLLKGIDAETLVRAIKSAYAGDTILPSRIAKKITAAAKLVTADRQIKLKKAFSLSDREVDVAVMIYEGFTNRQISTALEISEGTTRNYISSIYEKLGADNRVIAVQTMADVLR